LGFPTLKECSVHLGRHLIFDGKTKIITQGWEIKKSLSEDEIKDIMTLRSKMFDEIKKLKTIPHDPIPAEFTPTDAYFGGFFDGDGRFDTHGKSGQRHTVVQKYPEICNLFKQTFGGTMYFCSGKNAYAWDIHTGADEFLRRIAPHIVGKKKQADMILAMKPGDATKTHAALSKLKGKGAGAIYDKNTGVEGGATFTPVRDLPKGVFNEHGRHFVAQIQYEKKIYKLGKFKNPEDAHELYMRVKKDITMSKANGKTMDMSAYNVSTTKR
jgi:hypothetical protein